MAELRWEPRSRVKPESTYLQVVRRNVASQAGEDGLIERIFSMMGTTNKTCVEFGAWDGKHLSNSWNLIANKGWRGVPIEGDPARFQYLLANYAGNDKATPLNRMVGLSPPDDLDSILATTDTPEDFDLLIIDVDGIDYHIWKSLQNYRPRLLVIEFNQAIPNDIHFVQDANATVHHGSSLRAMIALGKEKGYELVATTELNALFVRRELFPVFEIADNDIDSMHSPGDYESKLFQLYDGTLVLAGCRMLLWAEQPITQEAI
ncbi:MAG: hypothetical protein QGF53_03895, partial [Alphaproteobacteria bacterium]|nr:hypothetical protein [Alphaproteobacteria bacterium]